VSGRLAGRIALITGARAASALPLPRRFAAEGAHVVLAARTVGGLEELDDAIGAAGGSATLVPLDLRDFIKIDELAAKLFDRYGRLDILVGNAAEFGVFSPLGHNRSGDLGRSHRPEPDANWRLIRAMDPLLRAAPAGRAIFVTIGSCRRRLSLLGPLRGQQGGSRNAGQDLRRRDHQDPGARQPARSRDRPHTGCAPAPFPAKTRAACRRRKASPTPSSPSPSRMHAQRRGGHGLRHSLRPNEW